MQNSHTPRPVCALCRSGLNIGLTWNYSAQNILCQSLLCLILQTSLDMSESCTVWGCTLTIMMSQLQHCITSLHTVILISRHTFIFKVWCRLVIYFVPFIWKTDIELLTMTICMQVIMFMVDFLLHHTKISVLNQTASITNILSLRIHHCRSTVVCQHKQQSNLIGWSEKGRL